MIYKLSENIVDYLEKNHVLKEDKEIYLYSTRLMISTLIGTILIFIIGIVTNHFIEAIIYEIVISSSRRILGGYHSKTYFNCILTYMSLFVFVLVIDDFFQYQLWTVIVIGTLSLILVYKYCPIENVNKLISMKKKKICKMLLAFVLVGSFCFMGSYNDVAASIRSSIYTIGAKSDVHSFRGTNQWYELSGTVTDYGSDRTINTVNDTWYSSGSGGGTSLSHGAIKKTGTGNYRVYYSAKSYITSYEV